MPLVWVTGVSGSGKSTLCRVLRDRGHEAFDADDGFCQWVDTRTGVVLDRGDLTDGGWADHIDWVLVPERVASLARRSTTGITFLCGSVSNEAEVWELFDAVIALVADDEVVRQRLESRTGDAFGARPVELAAVLQWNAGAHQTYEGFGATIVDASQPPDVVADRVLAAAATAAGLDEVPLTGGNVAGAVRLGETVRRRTGPWTPAVHELLEHVAHAGVPAVPRVHGIDDRDREILDYLPGDVIDVDTQIISDARLAAVGRWLRTLHAATASFPTAERRWYFGAASRQPGQVICHNDVAPYNIAFDGDALAGVFDWELAGPGDPIDDVAFMAWNGLPLLREVVGWSAADVASRARMLTDAYADPALTPSTLLERAITRMVSAADSIEAGQRLGDTGMLGLARIGEPAATRERIDSARDRLPAILAALG